MHRVILVCLILSCFGCSDKETTYVFSPEAVESGQELLSVLEIGTYTDSGQPWCSNSVSGISCTGALPPLGCAGAVTFGDFTIYGPTTGSFFNSLTESIVVDEGAKTITLQSGISVSFDHSPDKKLWLIMYSPTCGKRYAKAS